MTHRVLLLCTAAALTACRGSKDSSWTDSGFSREVPSCAEESPTLGTAGEFGVDSIDFTYEWADDLFVSAGPVFTFEVPADTTGLSATVDVLGLATGFAFWGLGDDVFIDVARADESDGGWYSAPYWHWGTEGGSVVMPISPGTLPDGGGCLFVQPAALQDLSGETGTLHLVTRRYDAGFGEIDVNVVVVGGAAIDQDELDATIARMDAVWSRGGGPSVGTVSLFLTGTDPLLAYADSNELRSTVLPGASAQAVNLFIIDDYLDESGTLGEAGGIPGPLGLQEVDAAGVIVALDGHRDSRGALDLATMGETMAHEIGHQVGLFHTTESDGTRTEPLDDTAGCPRSADTNNDDYFTAEECADHDGRNFMFWVAGDVTQDEVSDAQALVLSRSVVAR